MGHKESVDTPNMVVGALRVKRGRHDSRVENNNVDKLAHFELQSF